MNIVTINITKEEAKEIQGWLDSDQPIPDAGDTETVKTYTAKFSTTIEADIKICNTDSGPFIDCILFDDGHEAVLLDPQYVLLGSYAFEYQGITYEVILKKLE